MDGFRPLVARPLIPRRPATRTAQPSTFRGRRVVSSGTQIRGSWAAVKLPVLGSDWPLVGRDGELAAADEALASGSGGVWLSGPAGVGKTRLAHEIVGRCSAAGSPTLWLGATPGMSAVPLGPFRHLLNPADPVDAAEGALWDCSSGRSSAGRRGGTLVVTVDDADLLDELSAAFVHRLAANPETFVILTVRDDLDRPEALTATWKDGLVERLDIGALGRDQAEATCGSRSTATSSARPSRRCGRTAAATCCCCGSSRSSALEDGTLTRKDAVWSWRGARARQRTAAGGRDDAASDACRSRNVRPWSTWRSAERCRARRCGCSQATA